MYVESGGSVFRITLSEKMVSVWLLESQRHHRGEASGLQHAVGVFSRRQAWLHGNADGQGPRAFQEGSQSRKGHRPFGRRPLLRRSARQADQEFGVDSDKFLGGGLFTV